MNQTLCLNPWNQYHIGLHCSFFLPTYIFFIFKKSFSPKECIFLVLQFESSRSKINCLRLMLVILIFPSRNLVSSLLMGSLISFIIVRSYFCLALYIPYYIGFFFLVASICIATLYGIYH